MARIRTVKPEFWTSGQIVRCCAHARLLFIGLWNFCDDHGVHPADPKRLKMEVFPGDSFGLKRITKWMNELIDAGLVKVYEADGQRYWCVTGWSKHQRIDKPNYKHPEPPHDGPLGDKDSTNARQTIHERSTNPRRGLAPGREGKGEGKGNGNGNGKECKGDEAGTDLAEVHARYLIPLNDGSKYPVDEKQVCHWQELYPAVDVEQEIRKMIGWCEGNPNKRKTKNGVAAFINRWLAKEQDQPGSKKVTDQRPTYCGKHPNTALKAGTCPMCATQ